MSERSYCRFEDTLYCLKDCYEAIHHDTSILSEKDMLAREGLINLCEKIAKEMKEYRDGKS